jgi:hypothetical protein
MCKASLGMNYNLEENFEENNIDKSKEIWQYANCKLRNSKWRKAYVQSDLEVCIYGVHMLF